MAVSVVGGSTERGTSSPRLSWRIESDIPATSQTAYRLKIGGHDTGWIDDPNPLDRTWPGPAMRSRDQREWRVQVRTTAGESDWSEPWVVEAGLLGAGDWEGLFVSPGFPEDSDNSQPCPLLRRRFTLNDPPRRARLYVTALGCYEIEINGRKVGDELLAPGWTPYGRRLLYRTHDVGDLLRAGENVIGATLADGWYRGYLGWGGLRNRYGKELALLAQLEISTAGGELLKVVTDERWRSSTGRIRSADLYRGETVDARHDQPGWSEPGFDDSAWSVIHPLPVDVAIVSAAPAPPVKAIDEIPARSVERRPDGSVLVDFGQNLVGHVRFVVPPGPRTVVVRHAEVLAADGSLRTDLLRTAWATDTLTTNGARSEVFEPRFTFHGFRYAEISGAPELAGTDPRDIVAVVVSAGLEDIGEFNCSVDDVNRLHANVRWSLRGNFVSIPTDCPQRDERLGWTGDAQVFAPAAAFLVDAANFLSSWLEDVALDQREDGAIPWVVPNVLGPQFAGAAGWGDVITCMPFDLYVATGDRHPLELAYDAMRRWTDFQLGRAGENLIWSGDFQFGDWLDPDAPPGEPNAAKAGSDLVATAYMCRSLGLVARAAEVLDRHDDTRHYDQVADHARKAWWDCFGEDAMTSQTGCAMALRFGLAPPDAVAGVGAALHQLVEKADGHLATGFLGTPLLCHALVDAGYVDDAYRVLLQRTPPSWLFPITKGATTMWERWDAIRPDGTVNADPLESTGMPMVSFNHYAYGAVADFLHQRVAGLAPDPSRPGYGRVLVAPSPGGGLSRAMASHRSRYGPVAVSWDRDHHAAFHLAVSLPPGTSAEIRLPSGDSPFEVTSGQHQFRCSIPS